MFKKQAALFLLLIPIICFSSCGTLLPSRFEPVKSMSCTLEAKKGDFSFSCKASCSSYDDVRLEFISPKSLSGLSFCLSNGEIKVDAYGITDNYPADFLDSTSPVSLLLFAVRDGLFDARDFTSNGDGTVFTEITVGKTPVKIIYNESGFPVRIDVFSTGLSALLHYETDFSENR